jgi:hypothetical protein
LRSSSTAASSASYYDELMARTDDAVMTRAVVDVEPDAPSTHVLEPTVSRKARSFAVRKRDGGLAGVIAREGIMRALKDTLPRACAASAAPGVPSADADGLERRSEPAFGPRPVGAPEHGATAARLRVVFAAAPDLALRLAAGSTQQKAQRALPCFPFAPTFRPGTRPF